MMLTKRGSSIPWGRCVACGRIYIGWVLDFEETRVCPACGQKLEIVTEKEKKERNDD